MSFEETFKNAFNIEGFGKERYILCYKERPNISRNKLDEFAESVYLDVGSSLAIKYSKLPPRYISALDITYDLLVSIYEINAATLFTIRYSLLSGIDKQALLKFVKGQKNANFEARVIGMQNNEDTEMLGNLSAFLRMLKIPIVEVDLFGNDIRHIAIDSKTGMSFNILKENRIYRPGELANKLTYEQFQQSTMKAPSQKGQNK
ncbi:MAG: hypothetical protein ACP5K5_02625 [Candidatus Micrarchaeia archaeon]